MQKVLEFLKNNPVFYYATVDGNEPRVRPFGFFMEYNGRLYIGMGKKKESYLQTIANPSIEICTSSPDGKWIRIRGKAVEDKSPEVLQKAREASPTVAKLYNEQTGAEFACFYIEDGTAELADMSGNFEKITF